MAQTDPVKFELSKPVERELKSGETQTYILDLRDGEFISVKTEQKGIDVVVTLLDPEGKEIVAVNSPKGTSGEKPLLFIADIAGQYLISVGCRETEPVPGKYEITLAEARPATVKDQDATARFIGNRAIKYFGRDNHRARELANRSLGLAENAGSKDVVANELQLIGNIYAMEGDLTKAIEHHKRTLAIKEELKDPEGISFALNNLGIAYQMLGNFDESLKSFNESCKIMLESGEKGNAAVCVYNIGIVYRSRGDFSKAMTYFQKSAALFQEAGEKEMPADLSINIAGLYKDEGVSEQAIAFYEKALPLFEASRDNYGLYQTLDGLGGTYYQIGDYPKAIEQLQRALAIEEKMNSRPDLVDTLRKIGQTYVKLGNHDSGDQYYQRALKLTEEQANVPVAVSLRIAIARLRLAQGKTAEAVSLAEQAKASFEAMIGPGSNSELYDVLGQAYLAEGRTDKAKQMFQLAVEEVESERQRSIGIDEDQSLFFNNRISPYRSLVSLLHLQGFEGEAFKFSERGKSRTIIDALQSVRVDNNGAMTSAERERERLLRNELVSLNTQIANLNEKAGSADALRNLTDAIQKKRLEFGDFRTRVYAVHPELQVQRGEIKPVTIDETAALMPDDQTAVAEFVVAEDKTFLFVITKDASKKAALKMFTVDVKDKELGKRVEAYRSKLASGDLDFQNASRELYDLLLKPAQAQLAGKTNLIIVPDGPLWDLPFQALTDEKGNYLVEKSAVSYAPSLTALKEMSKRAKARKPDAKTELLAFGNPIVGRQTAERVQRVFMSEKLEPLPESERMVNELGKMYGANRSKVYVGDQAREETAKTESPKYKIVQFATHGILNNVSPMYSHLVLAQNEKNPNEDGLLEAWEMKDLDLKADMVILSACDTARGKISNGEGVIGMSWALFIAGTPTTVASQWKVESKSTTELMLEFHRQLLTGKVSKAQALRRAELKVMNMSGYKHPSYWASFVIVGDGS